MKNLNANSGLATTQQKSSWRNMTRRVSALMLTACALLFYNTASAQITIDGNPGDWPGVLSDNTILVKGFKVDPVNDKSDDKFTMGSQQVDPISGWHWKEGNVNDKEDIGNTGFALIGHTLYFFADLHADNGDASVGLWLLKNGTTKAADGTFTGAHQEGDILVAALFTKGHVTATPTIYRWTGGALTQVTVGPNVAGAATNSVAVTAPFPYTPKQGSAGTYPATTFFEGFINLDSLQGTFCPCFATFLYMTWESQSEHAALSDLVIGGGTIPTVTARDTSVCKGSTVPLIGFPAGGTWSGYGVVGNTFDATSLSPGCYTVSYWITGPFGCVGSTCIKVTVKKCGCGCMRGGLVATEPDGFTVYPNPSTGTFDMYLPALASDAVAEVVDIFGRVVDRRPISKSEIAQQLSYNLNNMSPGMYYIRVDNDDIHYSDKIMVK